MPLYKDPRTGDIKEFENASEAAGEGYFEEVKIDTEEFELPEGSAAPNDLLYRENEEGQQVDSEGNVIEGGTFDLPIIKDADGNIWDPITETFKPPAEATQLSNDTDDTSTDGEEISISPGLSKAAEELANAESKALDIINSFLKTLEGSNIYTGSDTTPEFEEETETYTPTKKDAAALYPYFPSNILDGLIAKWTETGSIDIALATVRGSDEYAKAFPGIRREDGTLRMTEIQYLELKDGMKDALRTYNLNPDIFADEITAAISGDVDIQEFKARLEFGYEQLLNNKDQVLEVFNEQYGYAIDETSLFAMFISPTISTAVLENQILTSQILAEAEIATVSVGLTTAEKFVEADISQKDAAKVFARTDELSGLTGAAAGRGNTITEEQIALGVAGLSPQELGLVKRVAAQEASESAIQTGAATTQGGQVVGLVEE